MSRCVEAAGPCDAEAIPAQNDSHAQRGRSALDLPGSCVQQAALDLPGSCVQQTASARPIRPATHVQRIGTGIDVHAFAEPSAGRVLILGGVHIEYERGLLGHSDADVLAHAIADALLGAARLGDIGQHFPDSNPAFAGADSLQLLAKVCELLRSAGWEVVDVDSVIIAQAPKLTSYREAMRANLAHAMSIDAEQVGVKATTSEWLGFTGRGEGIAAQAVALVCGADAAVAQDKASVSSAPHAAATPVAPTAADAPSAPTAPTAPTAQATPHTRKI